MFSKYNLERSKEVKTLLMLAFYEVSKTIKKTSVTYSLRVLPISISHTFIIHVYNINVAILKLNFEPSSLQTY